MRDSPAMRAGSLRRGLDVAVGWIARTLQLVFFREIHRTGLETIPREVPLVFVANHWNSVVDAVLLLALPGARPRLLAKSTLWSHPVMHPLLVLAGALPVYRRQDTGVNVAANRTTFARCHEALQRGENIGLFPEGTSHSQGRTLPLKSGAARIVLEAEARFGPLGVRIVPVGLNYQAKGTFRSRVRVAVGPAIDPSAERARFDEEPGPAVRALTARIASGLEEVTSHERWPEPEPAPRAPLWRRLVVLALGLPVFVPGVLLNWIPYRLPGFVSDRISRTPDDPATYKLLIGLLAFPLVWLAESAVVAHESGPLAGLAMALAAPATGYAVLRFREWYDPSA